QRFYSARRKKYIFCNPVGQTCCCGNSEAFHNRAAGGKCPQHIDCAREGRHFCKPGTSYCGPCLNPLEENKEGLCVARKRHLHGQVTPFSRIEEEIDYLHSVIAKQEVAEVIQSKQSDSPSKAEPKTQTEAPRKKGQAQFSTGQPTTTGLSTWTPLRVTGAPGKLGQEEPGGPVAVPYPSNDTLLIIVISACAIVGTLALILAAVCWVRVKNESHLARKVDYTAYGGPGKGIANGTSSGDKTLAQSAQMFHYQHQKQLMLSMEKHKSEAKVADTEATSDDDEVGGDFTVYECPGLAPTGEMEVKNPLFDDSTLPGEFQVKDI
uniref:Neural proliferation, differentiation and control, 1a n=1 Tax=Esox lucius TaxID=8010 RepID=A0A3P8XYJ1_ESOLU